MLNLLTERLPRSVALFGTWPQDLPSWPQDLHFWSLKLPKLTSRNSKNSKIYPSFSVHEAFLNAICVAILLSIPPRRIHPQRPSPKVGGGGTSPLAFSICLRILCVYIYIYIYIYIYMYLIITSLCVLANQHWRANFGIDPIQLVFLNNFKLQDRKKGKPHKGWCKIMPGIITIIIK